MASTELRGTLYTDLRKDRDLKQIKLELLRRGLPVTGGWKKDLLVLLHEGEADTKSFKPKCPQVSFNFLLR